MSCLSREMLTNKPINLVKKRDRTWNIEYTMKNFMTWIDEKFMYFLIHIFCTDRKTMDCIKFIWFRMSQYICNMNEDLSWYSILVCHQDRMTAWKLHVFVTLEQETVCGENDCLHYVSYFNKSIYSKATASLVFV